jgi:hypothetical protein
MNRNCDHEAAQAFQPGAEKDQPDSKSVAPEEKLKDAQTYEAYDQAMGELSDADSAASAAGPAV